MGYDPDAPRRYDDATLRMKAAGLRTAVAAQRAVANSDTSHAVILVERFHRTYGPAGSRELIYQMTLNVRRADRPFRPAAFDRAHQHTWSIDLLQATDRNDHRLRAQLIDAVPDEQLVTYTLFLLGTLTRYLIDNLGIADI